MSPPFSTGVRNPRFVNGRTITKKGYVRITAGVHRGKYEHRVIMGNLLGRPLRADEEVHHVDFNRGHNCPSNLILMDKAIHDFFSAENARRKQKGLTTLERKVD